MNENIRKAYQHTEPDREAEWVEQEAKLIEADPSTLSAQQNIRLAYIKYRVEKKLEGDNQ